MRHMLTAGLLIVAIPLAAQTPGPVPLQPAPADAAAEAARSERRYQLRVLEGILVNSVQHAAETMVRRLQAVTPALVGPMTDVARARGFLLPDYGVFFDVEVPGLAPSVVWSLRVMERTLDVGPSFDLMRQALASVADPLARREAEQALRRIELELGFSGAPAPGGGRDRAVEAAAVLPGGRPAAAPRAAPAERIGDPNEAYTSEVQTALVEAMLEYGGRLAIAPHEWFAIAARDSHGPSYPGEPYDAVTLVLRIKGSDLADYRADRITRDEARKRVEVREF